MTLAELDATLPNGFHDAEIEKLSWDFVAGTATFEMELWLGDEEDREKRGYARVDLKDILFIAIDPPYPRQLDPKPYRLSGTLQIDGVLTDNKIFPALPKLKPELPAGSEIFSFYVINSNSFIHISAGEASLIWRTPAQ